MKDIDLKHVRVALKNGGEIFVLDTGATITPESEAMLQALHSRSVGGIRHHLEVLKEKGPEKFMSSFYVGYGHKSIGDCGTVTIFIEGVSMLAAKAVQDWALYSGQESSTRYIDFSSQKFINPAGNTDGENILEKWRSFYLKSLEPTKVHLRNLYPKNEDEDEKIYDKAITARAFDILRGFLPAGASTNLTWHTNLRQAADKIAVLRHHPLEELRDIAECLEKALFEAYPSSFGHKKYDTTEEYNMAWSRENTYFNLDKEYKDVEVLRDCIDLELLKENKGVLETRPIKTELPKYLSELGTMQFGFMLDFGSFRDIQRHRAVTQRMPLLTSKFGFNPWYFKSIPPSIRDEAQLLIESQEEAVSKLKLSKVDSQYYLAMGYNLPNRLTGNLPSLVYLVELRATRFVHPTLQRIAIRMASILEEKFSRFGLALHLDKDPGRFDIKRGEHDITIKN
ncbi:MAG: hypothetical protein COU06_01085 [Candidatus Harrisonbacteria bacterium CG10_big_fil_rev_8_21_14_0_10_38_8]|uniref:Thymidylate synthase n=1 Tax=Candidatus Harrisonbacteria bacterium CG10_big_fil_rev_8_21_14_0_10_38_8 TaxID=1974582 RepID=A0A2M6WKA4_9BACT|nr:MAG: hypothetical protein COU06_01085 [Candidatus Harrisonbacteria bacterium CG10_big_fil_rev_8_21_14_0_10_38_8]